MENGSIFPFLIFQTWDFQSTPCPTPTSFPARPWLGVRKLLHTINNVYMSHSADLPPSQKSKKLPIMIMIISWKSPGCHPSCDISSVKDLVITTHEFLNLGVPATCRRVHMLLFVIQGGILNNMLSHAGMNGSPNDTSDRTHVSIWKPHMISRTLSVIITIRH